MEQDKVGNITYRKGYKTISCISGIFGSADLAVKKVTRNPGKRSGTNGAKLNRASMCPPSRPTSARAFDCVTGPPGQSDEKRDAST